jgi:hypothetical protein
MFRIQSTPVLAIAEHYGGRNMAKSYSKDVASGLVYTRFGRRCTGTCIHAIACLYFIHPVYSVVKLSLTMLLLFRRAAAGS